MRLPAVLRRRNVARRGHEHPEAAGGMIDALWWYVTVQAIGLAAFPIAYALLPRLTDRGYSVSKPLGILVIGYLSWMLAVLHVVPSVRLSITMLLLLMASVSAWYAWGRRHELLAFMTRERRTLLLSEGVFLLFFVVWVVYRAYDPGINHTEQPMDFGFLNASIQTYFGQPEDPWLRGESVSYYYFGYWMMGAVSQLTGVVPSVSYNLALALVPALAAMAMFGLVFNLVRSEARRWGMAVFAGLAAALLVGVVANLEGVLEFMRANGMGSQGFWDWVRIDGLDGPVAEKTDSWMPQEFWWWWRTSRVINTFDGSVGLDYTIQEFPFFSFILGDLHPHVMSIPFALLFLALCWNLLRTPLATWARPSIGGYTWVLAMGLVLGGLAFTNLWDLPTFSALLLAVAALKTYPARRSEGPTLARVAVPLSALAVIGIAFVLYIPYYLTFSGSTSGVEPVAAATTRPVHLFIVWGVYLVAIVPLIFVIFSRSRVTRDWPWMTGVALLIGFAPYVAWAFLSAEGQGTGGELVSRLFKVLPLIALISAAAYTAVWASAKRDLDGRLFALVLSGLGLLLLLGPELLYVGDSFNSRMNTVFKLYYQGWVLLSIATGYAIYYWSSIRESLSGWSRWLTTAWAGAFAILLVGSLYYPPAAATSKGDPFNGDATLDGLAYIDLQHPAEYEAIAFLRDNAGPDSAVLEAVGDDYSEFGRISSSTGVPTVFNWPGHEVQWRGDAAKFDGRAEHVAEIYQTSDPERARNLLARYDVDYVYVGHRERQKYGDEGLSKFQTFADAVFSKDDVVIYRLR